jgi:eukaryotic-like serine/threonine-protein kinase
LTKTHARRRRWESWFSTRPANVHLVLWIVGLGVGGFLLGYLIIALFFFRGGSPADVVAVPELREMGAAQARHRLDRLDLLMEIGDSLPNPEVAAGAVLAQSPLPGREVLRGSAVRVILSAGPERRTVADVSEMGRDQAARMLEALGFQVEVTEATGPQAAGRVIATDPPAGTTLPLNARVTLTVSTGPPMAEVPEVLGLTEADARDVLTGVGFRLAEIEYEYRISGVGTVISQWPFPGDSLRAGSAVQIRVATDRFEPEPFQ